MNNENDFIMLASFLVVGVIIASGLSAILQNSVIFPVTLFGFALFSLMPFLNKEKGAHFTENIEKWIFFLTLIIIVIAFVLLYTPA